MNIIEPQKALTPAYRKHKLNQPQEVKIFIQQLKKCIAEVNLCDERGEKEEHLKKPIGDFLIIHFTQKIT